MTFSAMLLAALASVNAKYEACPPPSRHPPVLTSGLKPRSPLRNPRRLAMPNIGTMDHSETAVPLPYSWAHCGVGRRLAGDVTVSWNWSDAG
jgi:hypothetical protein